MKYVLVITFFLFLGTTHGNSNSSDIARETWTTVKECVKSPKCIPFCALKQLHLTDKDGNLQTDNIPFFYLYNNATLVKCMETHNKKKKCNKINSVAKCLAQTEYENYMNNIKACKKETKFQIKHNFRFGDLIAMYSDEKYMCFSRCMWIKQGVIGADNNFKNGLVGNLLHTFGSYVPGVDAAAKKCGEKKDKNKCNEVFERISCFAEEIIFANI